MSNGIRESWRGLSAGPLTAHYESITSTPGRQKPPCATSTAADLLALLKPARAPSRATRTPPSAHPSLATVEADFQSIAATLAAHDPGAAAMVKDFVREQGALYRHLNPALAGCEEVRAHIYDRLENLRDTFHYNLTLDDLLPIGQKAADKLTAEIRATAIFPIDSAETLATARYAPLLEELAHPPSFTAIFSAAQAAQRAGYQVAMIINPDHRALAPILNDAGISADCCTGDITDATPPPLRHQSVLLVVARHDAPELRTGVAYLSRSSARRIGVLLAAPAKSATTISYECLADIFSAHNDPIRDDIAFLRFLHRTSSLVTHRVTPAAFRRKG